MQRRQAKSCSLAPALFRDRTLWKRKILLFWWNEPNVNRNLHPLPINLRIDSSFPARAMRHFAFVVQRRITAARFDYCVVSKHVPLDINVLSKRKYQAFLGMRVDALSNPLFLGI
jgi:hypothetical protein